MTDLLQGGSTHRMAKLRAAVIKHNAKPHVHMIDWRRARGWNARINGSAHGAHIAPGARSAGLPDCVVAGFRDVGASHDIVRMRHTGWFTDEDGSLICGHVWQLPARNGEPVYLAGYVEPNSGYVVLSVHNDMIETWDDKEDAARAADSLAERAARDLESDNETAHDEIKEMRERARLVVTTIRFLSHDGLRSVYQAELVQLREDVTEKVREIISRNEQLKDMPE